MAGGQDPPSAPQLLWGCPTAAEQDGGALPALRGSRRCGTWTRYVSVTSLSPRCVPGPQGDSSELGTCHPLGLGVLVRGHGWFSTEDALEVNPQI